MNLPLKDNLEPSPVSPPRLAFTLNETAQMLGVSYITAFRLNKRGLLRSSSALRTKLIPRSEIERFLRENMEGR